MKNLGDILHLYVHAHQLRQIKVHFRVIETKHLIGNIALHARFLALEQVVDGHRHVKHLALEQPQQPCTRLRCLADHAHLSHPVSSRYVHHFRFLTLIRNTHCCRRSGHYLRFCSITFLRSQVRFRTGIRKLDAGLTGGRGVGGACVRAAEDAAVVGPQTGQLVPMGFRCGMMMDGACVRYREDASADDDGFALWAGGDIHFGNALEGGVKTSVSVMESEVSAGHGGYLGYGRKLDAH